MIAVLDVIDPMSGKPVSGGQKPWVRADKQKFPYFDGLFWGNLGESASLANHIRIIVGNGALKKMIGVNAQTNVAVMANAETGPSSFMDIPRNVVCQAILAITMKPSISLNEWLAGPKPAFSFRAMAWALINLVPKPNWYQAVGLFLRAHKVTGIEYHAGYC